MTDRQPACTRWVPRAPRVRCAGAGLLCLLAGCLTTPVCDQGCLSGKVAERTGFPLGPPPCEGKFVVPNGVSLTEGLTEEGAVLVGLWNNAAFLELLADIGIAHGDLVQAGL